MKIETFYHQATFTFTHVIVCENTKQCAVIDPCLDFDQASGKVTSEFADSIVKFIESNLLSCQWILETHAHADHLSSAQWLKRRVGGKVAIGSGIQQVQAHFKQVFNLDEKFKCDGSQFDHLFVDGESFLVGDLKATVLATPGHTNDSVSYCFENAVFTGDTIFAPQRGSARCDFPGVLQNLWPRN